MVPVIVVLLHMNIIPWQWKPGKWTSKRVLGIISDSEMSLFSQVRVHYSTDATSVILNNFQVSKNILLNVWLTLNLFKDSFHCLGLLLLLLDSKSSPNMVKFFIAFVWIHVTTLVFEYLPCSFASINRIFLFSHLAHEMLNFRPFCIILTY